MSKSSTEKLFKIGDSVVYPSHGVGKITNIEVQVITGFEMKLYVILFDKDKMVLRVPVSRAEKVGPRQLSNSSEFKKAITTFKSKSI